MTIGLWFINFYYCEKVIEAQVGAKLHYCHYYILCKNWFLIHSLDERYVIHFNLMYYKGLSYMHNLRF